ncbi:hypothetical protein LguiA_031896 [Lonicera macranthoides]
MTIIIEQSHLGLEEKDNKVQSDSDEMKLDGGFLVPENNSYGNSFRDYNAETERKKIVEEFYRLSHINQTYDFVKRMREEYGKLDKVEMSMWECCELLNEVVDDSDPDLDEPQIEHLLQTAEAIRKDYPNEDCFGGLPQWAVVGDTFPLGCAFDESIVHHKYFKDNEDYKNPAYNTKNGIYKEGCGLDNVMISWGHDDYIKYDLYSKSKVRVDVQKVKPYYLSLVEKYFPAKLRW